MRIIGQLPDEPKAKRFADFLFVSGIENQIEGEAEGRWSIWVYDEERLDEARRLLERYQSNPADPKIGRLAQQAESLRSQQIQEKLHYQKKVHEARQLLDRKESFGFGLGPVTFSLMTISVAVFLFSGLRMNVDVVSSLLVTDVWEQGAYYKWMPGLPELRHGQIWRAITPIFVHADIFHILFNLWWLAYLGGMIEKRQSSGWLTLLVLSIAATSNLAQYAIVNPVFCGMSGVVFGLFGYVWTKMKFDPHSGYFIDPINVGLVLVWFFICLTGWVGQIANVVHSVGLGVGMLWGFVHSRWAHR